MWDLSFPTDKYEIKEKKVQTKNGEISVRYKRYRNLVYTENPVLPEFQSMNVEVPVSIDGISVDTSNAPILMAVRVGAYMATKCGGERLDFMAHCPSQSTDKTIQRQKTEGKEEKKEHKNPPPVKENDRILDLALASGWVLVRPGNRGRGLQAKDGTWLGKAPAVIVDLKAAVRYIRRNRGIMPGNPEHIIAHGLSAGGAMSALLGASGNSELYEPYLREIGAADERDDIFASADFCPMCDLEHADMAYEWMYGAFEKSKDGQRVDQEVSKKLAEMFSAYQASLGLVRHDTGEPLTAENYKEYLESEYLIPAANEFLSGLDEKEREKYLKESSWIEWDMNSAHFTVDRLHEEIGRRKELPAFDDPNKTGECEIFGAENVFGENFTTEYRIACGERNAGLSELVKLQAKLMNPMPFILENHPGCAEHWWIRLGTRDNGMSFSVAGNLAAGLEKAGKDVSLKFYWDAGHYVDLDPEDFVTWVNQITSK